MILLFVIFLLTLFCFSFVLFFGAPYLPTLKKEREQALDLLDLKEGQMLLELGCGDGRLLSLAAKKGIKSIGYELNPLMVLIAKLVNVKHRGIVNIKWANFWDVSLPECDGIYVFLLAKYMNKLDSKINKEKSKNLKLISYGFKIKGKKVTKKQGALYLYQY